MSLYISTIVLQRLAPNAAFGINGDVAWEYDEETDTNVIKNVTWASPEVPIPSKEEFDTAYAEELAKNEYNKYQARRLKEYPPLADLADALYWQAKGDESKMTAYLAAVQAVKEKYPKGN